MKHPTSSVASHDTINGDTSGLTSPRPLNVIVTGGSCGIGSAIVRSFALAGHRVLFTYRSGLRRAQKLQATLPNTTTIQLDQAVISSIATFATTAAKWSDDTGIDVLVNNAALGSDTVMQYVEDLDKQCNATAIKNGSANTHSTPNNMPSETCPQTNCDINNHFSNSVRDVIARARRDESLLKVNALGPLWVTDALTDQLHRAAYATPKSRATVIFIGSVGGGSSAIFPEYCAADSMSKAAVAYLSKHIAAKYVREPVDVMCLSPGATETDMFRGSTLSKVSDPDKFIDGMPKRRLIQPDEIAQTVLWLCTQSPPGIFHGAVLDASMGLSVRPGLQTETENAR